MTGAASFSESTSEHKDVVPAGKRWILLNGVVNRDASQTVNVSVRDSTDARIYWVLTEGAATGENQFPEDSLISSGKPIIMDPADYIHYQFGGAQSTAAFCRAVVIEVALE